MRIDSKLLWALTTLTLLASLGCEGDIAPNQRTPVIPESNDRDAGTSLPECPPPEGLEETDRVMRALYPNCAGCHRTGEKGYFASLDAFVSLLVANPRLVQPGAPDESELVRLLEGDGSGTAPHMPLAGAPYADLEDAALSMAEIRTWIAELGRVSVSTAPDPEASTIARLRADMFGEPLLRLLGLTTDDITSPAQEFGVPMLQARTEDYAVLSTDTVPPARNSGQSTVHLGLGGASIATSVTPDPTPNATFAQFVVPLSQRYCERSVALATSPLFSAADASTGSDEPERVKTNLRDLVLRFHGSVASDAEIDVLFDEVFVPVETDAGDPRRAWVAVCSTLIRDPRFVFY